MLSDFLHFIEIMFALATMVLAIFVVLIVVVARMPKDNPLHMILAALARRVGATAALMFIDPVATAVPVGGEVFDIATTIGLAIYWYTFFSHMARPAKPPATTSRKG